jgi:hypothetical protein
LVRKAVEELQRQADLRRQLLAARLRLVPISSFSMSRPPRSMSRSRRLCLTCCRT